LRSRLAKADAVSERGFAEVWKIREECITALAQ
jgi:hypothetical protein